MTDQNRQLEKQAAMLELAWRQGYVLRPDVAGWADRWIVNPSLSEEQLAELAELSVPDRLNPREQRQALHRLAGAAPRDVRALVGLAATLYRLGKWSADETARELYYLKCEHEDELPDEFWSLWDELDLAREGYGMMKDAVARLEAALAEFERWFDWSIVPEFSGARS